MGWDPQWGGFTELSWESPGDTPRHSPHRIDPPGRAALHPQTRSGACTAQHFAVGSLL